MKRVTDQVPPQSLTVAFHGNNDFSSEKMKTLLRDVPTPYSNRFHFLYTKDLNLFHQYDNLDFDNSLTKLEESRFVILIGLEVIFSSSMLSLIYSIPGRYGLDPSRENFFWHRAVVVFYVGDHQDHDQVIQLAINNNSGIREVVERVGGRYTHVPQSEEDFFDKLDEILIIMGDCNKTEIIEKNSNARKFSLLPHFMIIFLLIFFFCKSFLPGILPKIKFSFITISIKKMARSKCASLKKTCFIFSLLLESLDAKLILNLKTKYNSPEF